MIRLIAVAGLALLVATSAQGMTPAPIFSADSLITPVAFGCGPGRTRVNGVCAARTARHTRRAVRSVRSLLQHKDGSPSDATGRTGDMWPLE